MCIPFTRMVKTIKIPCDRAVSSRIQGTAFQVRPPFRRNDIFPTCPIIFHDASKTNWTERRFSILPPMARRLQLRQCVFVKNKVILRGQKIVSRENQKIIRFGAEKSGGGWSLSLQWRHDTWNAFTVLFTGDAIKQFEPLKSLGNTKCFQSVALESRILNEEVQR